MQANILTLGKNYFATFSELPLRCWRGIVLSLIEAIFMGIFYFLSIYFVQVLRLDIATAGSIISCYGIGAIIGGFAGKLSDKISPRKVSFACLFVQVICYLGLVILTTKNLLIINVFILGMATYGFITSNNLWVLNQCDNNEKQKLKVINLMSVASNLGLGISGILIGLFSQYGFSYIFITSAILLFALSSYMMLQDVKQQPHKLKKIVIEKKVIQEAVFSAKKNTFVIWVVLFFVLLIGSIVSQRSTTYTIYLESAFPQLGIKSVSILFTLNTFLVVLFATSIGDVFSKYNKLLMMGIGGFLIGFGMFMLSFSHVFFLVVISCIIYTLGEILFFSMVQLVCYQNGGARNKGQSLGMFRIFYACSRIIGPSVGTMIYHHFGGDIVWYLSGIIGFLCLVTCNYFKSLA